LRLNVEHITEGEGEGACDTMHFAITHSNTLKNIQRQHNQHQSHQIHSTLK